MNVWDHDNYQVTLLRDTLLVLTSVTKGCDCTSNYHINYEICE